MACGYDVVDGTFGWVQYVVERKRNGGEDGVYIPEDASR